MKILIASDLRAAVCNGRIFLASQHYYILKRYCDAFGACTLCCRVIHQEASDKMMDASSFVDAVIEVKSLGESLSPAFMKKIESAVMQSDLVIARLHSIIGMRVLDYAHSWGKKCFAELMGDAWDGLWNHGLAGKLIAPYVFLMTRKVTWNADYALYVTNEFLQRRYPCKNPSVSASNVQLEEGTDEILARRLFWIQACDTKNLCLMTTAAVDVRYKGQEYVIRAIPLLNEAGIRVKYLLVGGGDPSYLKAVARKCGVEDQVEFVGRKPLPEVLDLLDMADIYIQPSLQEGLPRSVIEAMSRGCPAIGAKTAGIPELLPPECVVRRKSARAIADAVMHLADRKRMLEAAKRNFAEAKGYRNSELNARRERYFSRIISEIDGKQDCCR